MTQPEPEPIDLNRVITIVVGLIVIGVVLAVYVGVLWNAGLDSLKSDAVPTTPLALVGVVTAVGGALATNFGAFLGVTVAAAQGLSARTVRASFKAPTIQAIAALFYVAILVMSLIFWWLDGLSPNTAEVIRTHAATLFGVGAGYLAVALNVKLK